MKIEQLQYFTELAKGGTFMEAAEKMNISQSNLSKNIIALEKEMGVSLFDRSSRKAELSAIALEILPDCNEILASYSKICSSLDRIKECHDTTVNIAVLPILSQYHLTGYLRQFERKHPNLNLNLIEGEDIEILSALQSRNCHLGILRKEGLDLNGFKTYSLLEDNLMAVLPENHPLARRKSISLKDLKNEKLFLMGKNLSISKVVAKAYEDMHIKPAFVHRSRMETIISLVSEGSGCTLLFEGNQRVFNFEGTVLIPLDEYITSTIVLAVSMNVKLSASERLLIEFLAPKDAL